MPKRTFSRDFKLELMRQVTAGLQRPAHLGRQHQRAASTLSPLLVLASLGTPTHGSAGVH
jgi:transposase-like protein